jgi:hypothetical protein
VWVFHKKTREPSKINRNMLKTQLDKRDDDGERAFTTVKPKQPPWRGTILCYLHKGRVDRYKWDALGAPFCTKAHIPTELDLQVHMRHRHPRSWAAMDAAEKKVIADEEREMRRAIIGQHNRSVAPVAQKN